MNIGLCDDDIGSRTMVREWITTNHPEITPHAIHEFMSGEALIEYLRHKDLDILFLDCRMTGMDGIETAAVIREQDSRLTIIILTDHPGYALLGYEVRAFHFILKKNFHKKVGIIFDNALKRIRKNEPTALTFKSVDGLVHMETEDILYVEGAARKKKLVLANQKEYEVISTLDEIQEILKPYGFVRPHCSFLVNARYIKEFKPDRVEVIGGAVLPVSRRMYKDAKMDFIRWTN